jgi:hypothetical protein
MEKAVAKLSIQCCARGKQQCFGLVACFSGSLFSYLFLHLRNEIEMWYARDEPPSLGSSPDSAGKGQAILQTSATL